MIYVILVLFVILHAMQDAFKRLPEKKELGHYIGAAMYFTPLLLPLFLQPDVRDIYDKIGCGIFIIFAGLGFRFALFNPVWNLSTPNVPINHVGDSEFVDRLESQYMPKWSFWITRVLLLGFGVMCVELIKYYY